MGSSQSAPAAAPPSDSSLRPSSSLPSDDPNALGTGPAGSAAAVSAGVASPSSSTSPQYDKKSSLTGMALVHHQCRKSKRKYDKCVAAWYKREFVTGQGSLSQSDACGDVFERYRECVLKGIKREVWDKQGLPPPKEGSPLWEIADDDGTDEAA